MFGLGIFVCWGISFYPQIFLNFRLKHTKGLSNFYQLMNIAGYSAYTLYNSFFYFSPVVQSNFCLANNGAMNVVRLSDVAFSWHAFLLTWVTVYQITIYSNDKRTGVIAILLFASIAGTTFAFGGTDLNFLYGLGTFKIFVTLIKYIPQVWLNYKRKSTIGWTIHNVLLDFTGGLTSTTQLFVDARSWKEVVADFPKLGLGSISMFFDIIFLVQHYVLYTEHQCVVMERATILKMEIKKWAKAVHQPTCYIRPANKFTHHWILRSMRMHTRISVSHNSKIYIIIYTCMSDLILLTPMLMGIRCKIAFLR